MVLEERPRAAAIMLFTWPSDSLIRRLGRINVVGKSHIHEQVVAVTGLERELAGPLHLDDLHSSVESVPGVEDWEEEIGRPGLINLLLDTFFSQPLDRANPNLSRVSRMI